MTHRHPEYSSVPSIQILPRLPLKPRCMKDAVRSVFGGRDKSFFSRKREKFPPAGGPIFRVKIVTGFISPICGEISS